MHDVIVLGGGPAGVSAALYAKARGMSVLLIEKDHIGGLVSGISVVSHYSGLIEHETGTSFSYKLNEQLRQSGCELLNNSFN